MRQEFLLFRGLSRNVAGVRVAARRDLTAALAIATQIPDFDPVSLARSQVAMANALSTDGQPGRALELHRSAARLLIDALGDDDVRVAGAWANLSAIEPDAEVRDRLMAQALDVFARVAPQHPHRATALVMHSQQLAATDDYAEAHAALDQALAIQSAALAQDDLRLASTATALGVLALEEGAVDEALRAFGRALEVRRLALGDDAPQVAAALSNVAIAHRVLGDYEAARDALERSLATWDRTAAPEALGRIEALDALGVVARLQGRLDESQQLHVRALALREQSLGREHPSVAATVSHLADTLHARGDVQGALGLSARALELRTAANGPRHHVVAHLLASRAEYFVSSGQYDEAVQAAGHALEIYERAPAGRSNVPRTRFTLQRARHGQGHRKHARRVVRRLRASLRPDSGLATEIDTWLDLA